MMRHITLYHCFSGYMLLFLVLLYTTTNQQLVSASSFTHERSKCPLTIPTSTKFINRPYNNKTIIAHRGASFSLPEHTLESYRLALELGADYIEPDLVSTKDGVLIALHTLDLNITTNVASVYPGRTSFSQHVNRTGYWTFDFTWDEIQLLKVKQRLFETGARSAVYDGLFGIPSFAQILDLWNDYNSNIVPLLHKQKRRFGIYAELKYPEWLQEDANISLVDLFLQELSTSQETDSVWNDTECASLKFDEYLVPPLVIQSFDGLVLKDVKSKWNQYHKKHNKHFGQSTNITTSSKDLPPMVFLVNAENCWRDEFWYHVGEYSDFLQGIGPDKHCLLGEEARPFLNRAKEHELAIHPWTVRSELEFVQLSQNDNDNSTNVPEFDSVQDEMRYWFCNVGVSGIFTENVDIAIQMASLPCPEQEPTPTKTTTSSNNKQLCYNTDREAQLAVGLAAGIMGIFVGSLLAFWLSQSRFCKSQRHSRRQLRVPTHDPVEVEMV